MMGDGRSPLIPMSQYKDCTYPIHLVYVEVSRLSLKSRDVR
jgi:hypothetical protein